jgi:UDP-N-acetylmuramoyl-L-alanyl-D-glutamate--2,6-diaminopimelate ligase
VRLGELLRGVEGAPADVADVAVGEVRDDSRRVATGDLFVAVRGETVDGHEYVGAAVERGASAVVGDRPRPGDFPPGATYVQVADARRALARIAANRFGRPADALKMVGVTGTNGKTTTNFLVEAVLAASGAKPGLFGTVLYRLGERVWPAPFTTPTPIELHQTLAEMRSAGATHVTMECSSHALELDRLEGIALDAAAFTNLTQDHLDFHGDMETYGRAKARLFAEHLRERGTAVVLIDHPWADKMIEAAGGHRVLTATAREGGKADLRVVRSRYSIAGIEAELETPVGKIAVKSPLIGGYNLENLLVAVGIGVALEVPRAAIERGVAGLMGVPGRVERVIAGQTGVDVFVDYAHTPDALERVMAAVRPLTRGRLIVVFGCGGDRDRTKRPKMGRAVARDADLAIVTSDNPRTEDPASIVDMVVDGVRGEAIPAVPTVELTRAKRGWVAIVDRAEAIRQAIAVAQPGDVVLIAGKGHEDYQIVGKTKHHFDDREQARFALEKMASAARDRHS